MRWNRKSRLGSTVELSSSLPRRSILRQSNSFSTNQEFLESDQSFVNLRSPEISQPLSQPTTNLSSQNASICSLRTLDNTGRRNVLFLDQVQTSRKSSFADQPNGSLCNNRSQLPVNAGTTFASYPASYQPIPPTPLFKRSPLQSENDIELVSRACYTIPQREEPNRDLWANSTLKQALSSLVTSRTRRSRQSITEELDRQNRQPQLSNPVGEARSALDVCNGTSSDTDMSTNTSVPAQKLRTFGAGLVKRAASVASPAICRPEKPILTTEARAIPIHVSDSPRTLNAPSTGQSRRPSFKDSRPSISSANRLQFTARTLSPGSSSPPMSALPPRPTGPAVQNGLRSSISPPRQNTSRDASNSKPQLPIHSVVYTSFTIPGRDIVQTSSSSPVHNNFQKPPAVSGRNNADILSTSPTRSQVQKPITVVGRNSVQLESSKPLFTNNNNNPTAPTPLKQSQILAEPTAPVPNNVKTTPASLGRTNAQIGSIIRLPHKVQTTPTIYGRSTNQNNVQTTSAIFGRSVIHVKSSISGQSNSPVPSAVTVHQNIPTTSENEPTQMPSTVNGRSPIPMSFTTAGSNSVPTGSTVTVHNNIQSPLLQSGRNHTQVAYTIPIRHKIQIPSAFSARSTSQPVITVDKHNGVKPRPPINGCNDVQTPSPVATRNNSENLLPVFGGSNHATATHMNGNHSVSIPIDRVLTPNPVNPKSPIASTFNIPSAHTTTTNSMAWTSNGYASPHRPQLRSSEERCIVIKESPAINRTKLFGR